MSFITAFCTQNNNSGTQNNNSGTQNNNSGTQNRSSGARNQNSVTQIALFCMTDTASVLRSNNTERIYVTFNTQMDDFWFFFNAEGTERRKERKQGQPVIRPNDAFTKDTKQCCLAGVPAISVSCRLAVELRNKTFDILTHTEQGAAGFLTYLSSGSFLENRTK